MGPWTRLRIGRAYTEFLQGIGFNWGKATPCAFFHLQRKLRLVIHGDDLTLLGKEGELDWFKIKIAQIFEIKHRGRLGPDEQVKKSIRY